MFSFNLKIEIDLYKRTFSCQLIQQPISPGRIGSQQDNMLTNAALTMAVPGAG